MLSFGCPAHRRHLPRLKLKKAFRAAGSRVEEEDGVSERHCEHIQSGPIDGMVVKVFGKVWGIEHSESRLWQRARGLMLAQCILFAGSRGIDHPEFILGGRSLI